MHIDVHKLMNIAQEHTHVDEVWVWNINEGIVVVNKKKHYEMLMNIA